MKLCYVVGTQGFSTKTMRGTEKDCRPDIGFTPNAFQAHPLGGYQIFHIYWREVASERSCFVPEPGPGSLSAVV